MVKTLTQNVADNLIRMIRNENYTPGMKLPTEKELCERFNVGRNTIREALRILASKNVIVVRQGSGSFICENPGITDDPLGLRLINNRKQVTFDLFEVLIMLEPSVAGLAARNATDEDIKALEVMVDELERILRGTSPSELNPEEKKAYIELTAKFHGQIVECAHNLVLTNLAPVIKSGLIYYLSETDPDYLYNRFPRTILNYIKDHDAVSATSEMRFHLLYDKHMLRKNDDIDEQ